MNKRCPGCKELVSDQTKQFCPACEKLTLSSPKLSVEELAHLSQIVLEKLKADWKFKGQLCFAVFIVVLAVVGVIDAIVGFNLKESMSSRFLNQENQAKQRIDEHLASLDGDVKRRLSEADTQMRTTIARNFETPVIQGIIENVAKTEAKGILEKEVRPAVETFQKDAVFIRTIALANAYDFKAYQRLLELGGQTNDNARLADRVVAEIDRSLARDRYGPMRRTFKTISGTNHYSGPFASDELAMFFPTMSQDKTSFNREGFVNTVDGLKQPLFLPLLVELLTNETDLAVADRITIAISALAKEDFHPHDFTRITSWWEENHDSWTNWPLSALDVGLRELSLVNYSRASDAFEQVLKLDSGADMSRAYAISCYWETSQTNRALALAKEFKNPVSRWAQWAAAKAEIESGNISNGTVRFFSIATNFPTMGGGLPSQTSHIYRNIDWQLFNRLRATAP